MTPRFLVAGDHVELSAIVHNNTDSHMFATVTLDAIGFTLDESQQAEQTVEVSAHDRTQVTWWGTADETEQADLVIEAVFEVLELKQQVFAALDRIAKPGAVLASNTSTLDVDEIATATSRPGDVIGIEAGERSRLQLINFHGTDENPITFVNKEGQVRIGNSTASFAWSAS